MNQESLKMKPGIKISSSFVMLQMELKPFSRSQLVKSKMYRFPKCAQHIPKSNVELKARHGKQIAILLSEFHRRISFLKDM